MGFQGRETANACKPLHSTHVMSLASSYLIVLLSLIDATFYPSVMELVLIVTPSWRVIGWLTQRIQNRSNMTILPPPYFSPNTGVAAAVAGGLILERFLFISPGFIPAPPPLLCDFQALVQLVAAAHWHLHHVLFLQQSLFFLSSFKGLKLASAEYFPSEHPLSALTKQSL